MFKDFEDLSRIMLDEQQSVICMSGISGSGKSHLAREIKRLFGSDDTKIVSADHFFELGGNEYRWYQDGLDDAHKFCWSQFKEHLADGCSVIVDNTNTSKWEFQNYLNRAEEMGLPFYVLMKYLPIDICTARCSHNVPQQIIINQARRFTQLMQKIKNGIDGVSDYAIFRDSHCPKTMDEKRKSKGLKIVNILQEAGYPTWIVGGWATEIAKIWVNPPKNGLIDRAMDADINDVDVLTYAPIGVVDALQDCHLTNTRFENMLSVQVEKGSSEMINVTSGENHTADFAINAIRWDPYDAENPIHIPDAGDHKWDVRQVVFGTPRLDMYCPTSFEDDPHRAFLRMIRLSVNKGYSISCFAWEEATALIDRLKDEPFLGVSPERVFEEMTKILCGGNVVMGLQLMAGLGLWNSPTPCVAHDSVFLEKGETPSLLKLYFPWLWDMIGCEQSPDFHPEGSVWQHTLLMASGLKKGCSPELAWSVLLHDAGKPSTRGHQKKGDPDRITFYGHDQVSEKMVHQILGHDEGGLRASDNFRRDVAWLCSQHMHMHNWALKLKAGCSPDEPGALTDLLSNKRRKEMSQDLVQFGRLVELTRLDCFGGCKPLPYADVDDALRWIVDTPKAVRSPKALVDGHDVMDIIEEHELKLLNGKNIGKALKKVRLQQLEGQFDNIPDEKKRATALNHLQGILMNAQKFLAK